jgi:pimeloyl-ACP methyl ester carboxylesterase
MDDVIRTNALLSKAMYDNKKEVDGWEIDKDLSAYNRGVFHKNGKAKVVFRGTMLNNPRDYGTDFLIAFGLDGYSSRVQTATDTVSKTIEKYGHENVSLTGHSLGGYLAAHLSRVFDIDAIGFDTAMSPLEIFKQRQYNKFHSVSTYYDPVSVFTRYTPGVKQQTKRYVNKYTPHRLGNYI